jgi:hypothetical protein
MGLFAAPDKVMVCAHQLTAAQIAITRILRQSAD